MYLSGPIFNFNHDPDQWILAHRQAGYAIACGLPCGADDPALPAFVAAANKAKLAIAEVGAWSNPMATDPAERAKALAHCTAQLALAERVGARYCVNIAGSRGKKWDGPHPDNLSPDTFALIVETTRKIIDAAAPTRTFYTLETMPWVFPESPDNYLALIRAIDRKHFAVHLDPVNMINCPQRMYHTGSFIRECFAKLGPWLKGCHAKDIKYSDHLTLHLDECLPGTGVLDYAVFLTELAKLDPATPLCLEHLSKPEEYAAAAAHIRQVAAQVGVTV